VDCNTYLKFDHLIQKMNELECDFLATGHYAQIVHTASGKAQIVTSTDSWKDQTYFLFTIQPDIVEKLLFPIGHLNKTAVRQIALENNLVVAKKKDSTGICFVGNRDYSEFIQSQVSEAELNKKAGIFLRYPGGAVMGEHPGIHHFTIGQGRGLGLTHHEKLFVVKIDPETNDVWLGDESALLQSEVEVIEPRWLDEVLENEQLRVKIRYQHVGALARISRDGSKIRLHFDEPQRAVTPGQAAVFYRGKTLVGGGWIRT
jgi:tRNA-specific 2-thiouridylase